LITQAINLQTLPYCFGIFVTMKTLLLILLLVPFLLCSQHTIKDPNSGVISKYASDGQILKRYKLDSDGYNHGKREEWYSTGERYSIKNWKHGREYGKQTYWHKNGQLDMIIYKDDDAWGSTYGELIRYYENGQKRFYQLRSRKGYKIGADKEWDIWGNPVSHYNYKNGLKHGAQKEWNSRWHKVMTSLENYSEGKKYGLFKKWTDYVEGGEDLGDEGSLYLVENWKNDKKHGRFLSYDTISRNQIYERNYKDGQYDGVQKTYYENSQLESEENYIDGKKYGVRKTYYENGQLESEENYINDKKDGVQKTYYENSQLESEENHTNGKKDGVQKTYYENSQLESEENYTNGESKTKKLFENGILVKELINTEQGWIVLKARDSRGWISVNHGGKYLNYTVFQDEEHLSILDASINIAENIILEYKKNVVYHTYEIERIERNKIDYESKSDSLNLVLNNYTKKKRKKISKISSTKTLDILHREVNKIDSFIQSTENPIPDELRGKQLKLYKKITEHTWGVPKGSLDIIQRIVFLEDMIDSFSIILQDCNQAIFQHNDLLAHYSRNILPVEEYIEKSNLELDNEKLKEIYDLNYEYPEEFYSSKQVYRLFPLSSIPISFSFSKESVGPFRLGMTDADLLKLLNSDPFFGNLAKKMNNEPHDLTAEFMTDYCAIPCDFRIRIISGEDDLEIINTYLDGGLSQDEKYYRFKYEVVGQNGEWHRGHFTFYSNNDIIHTILFSGMTESEQYSTYSVSKDDYEKEDLQLNKKDEYGNSDD